MLMQHNNTQIKFDSLAAYRTPSVGKSGLTSLVILILMGLLFLIFVPMMSANSGATGGSLVAPVASLIICALLVIVVVFFVRLHELKKNNEQSLQAFATQNNFQYTPIVKDPQLSGSLFSVGDTRRAVNIISGALNGYGFRTYEYYYETGSGKRRATHDAMVFEITLPRVVPQFVIDSEIEDVIPVAYEKSQKIELEGDFHKYFDLYAPDTYGVTALTLLAPDTMAVLMEHAVLCDVEIVQSSLYFYWPQPVANRQQYETIFATASAVLGKIGEKLSRADIYATPSQASVHASPAGQGVRLKQSKWPIVTTVGFVILYVATQLLDDLPFNGWLVGIIAMGWIGTFVYIAANVTRTAQLKKEYLKNYRRS